FPFTVNHSFKNYESHPITIPQRHNDLVRAESLADEVRVLSPAGQTFRGHIYGGRSSRGDYFQLRIDERRRSDEFTQMPIGTQLEVTIARGPRGIVIELLA